ncbi:hypothetical protein Y032_0042g662 [Ancylostoma ceylanicum]|uniref:Uncharacterized protein n=1 Tax=Ancylostoma ceylanicum TaxID=53326 RepID=A0A016UGS1_9BILA|nr:hypothetical protein Y032_0042g662 [Ancylostoma ceylanicum]
MTHPRPRKALGATAPLTMELSLQWRIWLILIICEALILYMTATLSTDSAALSFLVDVGYIAFLIVFMETTCYIMHRTIRTEEYDAMKKNV